MRSHSSVWALLSCAGSQAGPPLWSGQLPALSPAEQCQLKGSGGAGWWSRGFEMLSPAGGVGARWADTRPLCPTSSPRTVVPSLDPCIHLPLSLPSWKGEGEVAKRGMVLRRAGWGGASGSQRTHTSLSGAGYQGAGGQARALRLSGGRRETGRWMQTPAQGVPLGPFPVS